MNVYEEVKIALKYNGKPYGIGVIWGSPASGFEGRILLGGIEITANGANIGEVGRDLEDKVRSIPNGSDMEVCEIIVGLRE